MLSNLRPYYYLLVGGVLLSVDQYLKGVARANKEFNYYLYQPWVGWEYFENSGVAFGLAVPNWVLIIVVPIIIVLFLYFFLEENHLTQLAVLTFLIPGAISNFIDRVLYQVTIDYFRVITSLFNLADILILAGIFILVFYHFQIRSTNL